jgi:formate dehydrogenase major subunit
MDNRVKTICPYCGAGCVIYLLVRDGQIVGAEPGPGRTNQSTLCLKGYYGWDFLKDTRRLTARLTKPLMKKGGAFAAVSWDEAVDFIAGRLTEIKEKYGPDAIMTTGCSRGPGNEANYIMQKFARAVLGTNNIDNCARV